MKLVFHRSFSLNLHWYWSCWSLFTLRTLLCTKKFIYFRVHIKYCSKVFSDTGFFQKCHFTP